MMVAGQAAAPADPAGSLADARRACLRAALLRASAYGILMFLLFIVFGDGPWRAFRSALGAAIMWACIFAPWRRDSMPGGFGSGRGWAIGALAAFAFAALWAVLGLPRD